MCDALNRLPTVTAVVASTDADGPNRFEASSWPSSHTKLHLFPAGRGRLNRSDGLRQWLDTNVREFDIVHTHSAWNDPVYAARRAAARHAVPLVYRPCGMLSPYTWTKGRLTKLLYWWVREKRNVASAAAIHCTSLAEADEVRAYRAARGAVHVIPLGVETTAWGERADLEGLRRRCGANAAGKPMILFLSRLHPKKGIVDLLLPAFKRLQTQAFLAIAGGTDESATGYKDLIHRTITELGLTDRVALLGPIGAAERWAMYDGADIFALPSHQENFGLVVAEAMARGLPVVVSDQVQISDDVNASGGGIVSARDPGSFATALDKLLTSADRKAIGERASVYARSHYNWDTTAQLLESVYRTVVGERPS